MLGSFLSWLSAAVRVSPAGSGIIWDEPPPLTFGEQLDERHFNALPPDNATAGGTFKYDPPISSLLSAGQHILTVTYTPSDLRTNKSARVLTATNKITVHKATPQLYWKKPEPIYFGTQLAKKHLCAACLDIPGGEYDYSPPLRTMCREGENNLTVTYLPEDNLRQNYNTVSMTVKLIVFALKQPTFEWRVPDAIVYGTALGPAQLCAILQDGFADKGVVSYAPAAGTVLNATDAAPLEVEFTPFNKTEYKAAVFSVPLTIRKAESVMTWSTPAAVYFGTEISRTQLNAACTNLQGGVFKYGTQTRTVLPVGTHELTVEYAPERPYQKNYNNGYATTTLVVMPLHQPVFSWPPLREIVYGTALGEEQLCAELDCAPDWYRSSSTSAVSSVTNTWQDYGTVTFEPPLGTVLDSADCVTLRVIFTPDNPLEVMSAEGFVNLRVIRADPIVHWPPLQPILMHTLLSLEQQKAKCSWPDAGEFVYAPTIGAHLEVGTHTLATTFIPSYAHRKNFNDITVTNELKVNKPEPIIEWSDPLDVHVGRPITKKHLTCVCTQSGLPPNTGTFVYDPPAGTLLPLGSRRPLTVTYTVAEELQWKYRPVKKTVYIDVVPPRVPKLTWTPPEAIPFGSKLTQFQLNAVCSVDEGFLYYDPPRGTVLASGETHTLKVTFIPNDHLEWAEVSIELPIYIYKTDPVLRWEPARYFYAGMALTEEHLCCHVVFTDVEIHGVMTYKPGLGAVLGPGEHLLEATFTCDKRHKREFNHVTKTLPFVVAAKKWPIITWPEPETIIYGTHLSSVQLCAASNVPGRLEYSPPLGALLNANNAQTLSVTFYPDNTVEYIVTTKSVTLCIKKATPKLHWEAPPFIYIGTAMLPKHLNATCKQPGTLIYCPELGEILPLGRHTLTVIFKPAPEVSHNFTFSSCFSTLLVITEGSLFKMPKRYLEPDVTRSFPVHDREFLLESDTLAWFSSAIDCVPPEPVRKVVEKMKAALLKEKNAVKYKEKDDEDRRKEAIEQGKIANWETRVHFDDEEER